MQPERLVQTRRMRGRKELALEAIRRHWYAYGASPSFSELGAVIDVRSAGRISAIVRELAAAGKIEHRRGEARGLRLPRPLANHATSELLLELQARGLTLQVRAAVDPVSLLAADLAADLCAGGTIEQLAGPGLSPDM